jgi:hypothetical protein
LFIAALALMTACDTQGDDNAPRSGDDGDDDGGGDDDDFIVPDDTTDDDTTDDDTCVPEQLSQDDGSGEGGISTMCEGCMVIQRFDIPDDYEIIKIKYLVWGTDGLTYPMRLIMYTSDDPDTFDSPEEYFVSEDPMENVVEGWNETKAFTGTFDVSVVFIGFRFETAGAGPYIANDKESQPGDEMWAYDEDEWVNVKQKLNITGSLMIRLVHDDCP